MPKACRREYKQLPRKGKYTSDDHNSICGLKGICDEVDGGRDWACFCPPGYANLGGNWDGPLGDGRSWSENPKNQCVYTPWWIQVLRYGFAAILVLFVCGGCAFSAWLCFKLNKE